MSIIAAMLCQLDWGHILIGLHWLLLSVYDFVHVADQLLVLALSNCLLLFLLYFAFRNVLREHALDKQVSMVR